MSEYTMEIGGLRVQSDGPLGELVEELAREAGCWRVYDNRTGGVVASSRAMAWERSDV